MIKIIVYKRIIDSLLNKCTRYINLIICDLIIKIYEFFFTLVYYISFYDLQIKKDHDTFKNLINN